MTNCTVTQVESAEQMDSLAIYNFKSPDPWLIWP